MLYTSPWSRFELTTSVVIGTDCIGSCKYNYHTITATTGPVPFVVISILSFPHSWLITRVATRVTHAGATCKAGTVYLSGAPEFTTGLAQPFLFCVMFHTCRSLFVLLALYCLSLFPSCYLFGTFKLVLLTKEPLGEINTCFFLSDFKHNWS